MTELDLPPRDEDILNMVEERLNVENIESEKEVAILKQKREGWISRLFGKLAV